MKVGIIGAMPEEIKLLSNKIKECRTIIEIGYIIYIGILNNIEVILLQSGIGKTSVAMATTMMMMQYKPDYIISTGSAGSINPLLKIGDVVLSDKVCYHDVDLTVFGYKKGQISGYPKNFIAYDKLLFIAEKILKQLNIKFLRGLIVSGDIFIHSEDTVSIIRYNFPQAIAVEMESAAIAQVCYQFKIPFIVIRVISDLADTNANVNFSNFLNFTGSRIADIIYDMLPLIDINHIK